MPLESYNPNINYVQFLFAQSGKSKQGKVVNAGISI